MGPEGAKRNVAAYRAAFPDPRATVEDRVAEGDRVEPEPDRLLVETLTTGITACPVIGSDLVPKF